MPTLANLSVSARWFSLLKTKRSPRRSTHTLSPRCQPSLDALEQRLVLSACAASCNPCGSQNFTPAAGECQSSPSRCQPFFGGGQSLQCGGQWSSCGSQAAFPSTGGNSCQGTAACGDQGGGCDSQGSWNLIPLCGQSWLIPCGSNHFTITIQGNGCGGSGSQTGGSGSQGSGSQGSGTTTSPGSSTTTPAPTGSISGYVTSNGTAVAGVSVTLVGTTASGSAVSLTTTTNSSGYYSFSGLAAGTYTVDEPLTQGAYMNESTPGTIAGSTVGVVDAAGDIGQIVLAAGAQGIQYDFGQVLVPA